MMWASHLTSRRIEDARFMLEVCKVHPARVAQRLGVTEDALHQLLGRSGDGQSDSEGSTQPGGAAGLQAVPQMLGEGE